MAAVSTALPPRRVPDRDDVVDLTPYGAPQLDVPVLLNTNEPLRLRRRRSWTPSLRSIGVAMRRAVAVTGTNLPSSKGCWSVGSPQQALRAVAFATLCNEAQR